MNYSEKLKDPRWQKKRLEIMDRDCFSCRRCGDAESTLNVHHFKYFKEPWDAEPEDLLTLCDDCHKVYHEWKKQIQQFYQSPMNFLFDPSASILKDLIELIGQMDIYEVCGLQRMITQKLKEKKEVAGVHNG